MRQKSTKQMLNYWMDLFWDAGNLAGGKEPLKWPERSDIQPAQCRSILGNMFILERQGLDVNYRLAGTTLCSLYGRELKRETFAEAFEGADRRSAEGWAHRLGYDDYIILLCSIAETASGEKANLETLLMPLAQNGENGNRILGITTPCEHPAWLGAYPIISQTIRSVRILRPWEKENEMPLDFVTKGGIAPPSSCRKEIAAPALFPDDKPLPPENSTNISNEEAKKFGHLKLIKGGLK